MKNDGNTAPAAASQHGSEPSVIGTSPVAEACKRAQESGKRIVAEIGSSLGPAERRKVLTAFRRTLFPARRPGRRRKEAVTAAHQDWKNGVCGPALYRTHIPGWENHNRYRRQSEARALMDAVRSRERRASKQEHSN